MPADRRTRVKMCGVRTPYDVELAVEAGADAVGMICAPSRRRVSTGEARAIAAAIPPLVDLFAVFVDPPEDEVRAMTALGAHPQYHGEETVDFCEALAAGAYLKAYHVDARTPIDPAALERFARCYPRGMPLVDSRVGALWGGTGVPFAWEPLRDVSARRRIIVSGGLTAQNVGECVQLLRPFAVDVSSGIETDGRKDGEKMRAFVQAVRAADAQRPEAGALL